MFTRIQDTAPGATQTYSAKSSGFTAGAGDRGTFFDCTGSFTVAFAAASALGAGWSCWVRNVSGTQTLDPDSGELINGTTTYAVSNAGDVVLVECTGTAFVVSHAQRPSTVAITGGSIDGTVIGGSSPAAGSFTTGNFSGTITSTGTTVNFTAAGTTLTVGATTGNPTVRIDGAASQSRPLTWRTASVNRWQFTMGNTESGSDAGADLRISAFDDAGASIDTPLTIARIAGGTMTIVRPVTLSTASSGLTIAKTTGTTLVVSSTTATTTTTTGCATFAGGIGVAKGATFGDTVTVSLTGATSAVFTKTVLGSAGGGSNIMRADDGSTAASSGDRLGSLFFSGRRDGSLLLSSSGIESFATEAWSNTAAGSELRLSTTRNTTISNTVRLTVAHDGAVTATQADTVTNAITDTLILQHNVDSGSGAAGLGSGLLWRLESSTTTNSDAGRITWEWATATHSSRKSRGIFYVYDTAAREFMRADTDGSVASVTFAGTTDATTATAAAMIVSGGIGVAKNLISAKSIGWGVTSTATAAGTTTLTSTSTTVQVFTGTSTQTCQLPAANLFGSNIAVVYVIKNRSTGNVTISRAGSDTIDGATSYVLTGGTNASVTLVSDGSSAWEVV